MKLFVKNEQIMVVKERFSKFFVPLKLFNLISMHDPDKALQPYIHARPGQAELTWWLRWTVPHNPYESSRSNVQTDQEGSKTQLDQVGPTIRTNLTQRTVRTEQARDPDVPNQLDELDRLSRVSLKDTSFRKFNLNFIYEK